MATPDTQGTSASARKPRQSARQKLDEILQAMRNVRWSLSEFLFNLFDLLHDAPATKSATKEESAQIRRHRGMVTAFLSGESKPTFATILELIYQRSCKVPYRANDSTQLDHMFQLGVAAEVLEHVKPALTTWAVLHVAELINAEADRMAAPESKLCVQISRVPDDKRVRKTCVEQVSWDLIDSFSLADIRATAKKLAPAMWHVLLSYADRSYQQSRKVSARKYRPPDIVSGLRSIEKGL